jgi:hypothetical protein
VQSDSPLSAVGTVGVADAGRSGEGLPGEGRKS